MVSLATSMSLDSAVRPKTLFSPETGMIQPFFARQLEIVGIATKQHFAEYPAEHILNVNKTLQDLCFQQDMDLFKKGGTSEFSKTLTEESAASFLKSEYESRADEWPSAKEVSCAIFPCGVEATMNKRMKSFIMSLEKTTYKEVRFIVQNATEMRRVLDFITPKYSEVIKNFQIIIANKDKDWVEEGLKKIAMDSSFDNYALIADPSFADKFKQLAQSVLPAKKCHGVASYANKNYMEAMIEFNYTGPGAKVKFCASECNVSYARQAHLEATLYKAKQKATSDLSGRKIEPLKQDKEKKEEKIV